MTKPQREALERFRAVRDIRTRRLLKDHPGCTPSRWVTLADLVQTHGLRRATIAALVRKGRLLERPSDGFGPEVSEP